MLYGIHPGIIIIILPTGIHGVRITGTIITGIIITGILIITDITGYIITTAIPTGMIHYYSQRRAILHVVTTRIESGSYRRTYSNPEARKAGYDMYYKKHPEQSARRSSQPIDRSGCPQKHRTAEYHLNREKNFRGKPDQETGNLQTVQANTRNQEGQPELFSRIREPGQPVHPPIPG